MNPTHRTAKGALSKTLGSILIAATFLLAHSGLHAATLNIPDTLIKTTAGVAPNVLLTFDNSGSMNRYYLPENIDSGAKFPRDAASAYNKMYYNPSITYEPGIDTSGKTIKSVFTNAKGDGYDPNSCVVNLSNKYYVAWSNGDGCGGSNASDTDTNNITNHQAYYYVYDESLAACTNPTAPSNNSCYTEVVIDSTNSAKTYDSRDPNTKISLRTDCADNTACTLSEEQQNFANWYSYYRNRLLAAKTAVSLSFWQISSGIRVSYLPINDLKTDPVNPPATSTVADFYDFTGTNKTKFLTGVQNQAAHGGTPMREAFVTAGENFTTSGIDSPYAEQPGVKDGTEYSCRQNFNIAITDGFWNSPSSGTTLPTDKGKDYDGKSSIALPETLIDSASGINTYNLMSPYSDTSSATTKSPTTLADIAFYYWITDLRPTMNNNVPAYIADATSDYDNDKIAGTASDKAWNPLNDPATWQHMVSFTIGLGLNGQLTFDDKYFNKPFDEPTNKSANITSWPNITGVSTNEIGKVDDLWHAAINGRGHYFSATDPNSLVLSLSGVLNNISSRQGSNSGVATSSADYQKGTSIYQTKYWSDDWHGDLISMDVVDGTTHWEAVDTLAAQNTNKDGTKRTIITYDPTTNKGIPFEATDINTTVATSNGLTKDIVNYLRGDQSKEKNQTGGTFRTRTYILGDIVDSAPEYVGPPDRLFPDSLESQPYSAFVAKYANRTPMVWVGANDGMVHGFDASPLSLLKGGTGGAEMLAYVPYSVYPNLASLSKPTYSHRFFVDGTPVSRDVFYTNAWHTVLVGGLNNGGQGIYALDITDPTTFAESSAASHVLWEFTDANDADLGKTFSTPQVVKMNNGEWVAIFGNGYNNTLADGHVSSSGDAVLYIVDIATGTLVKKLDTMAGMAQDPAGTNRPNGLSSIAVADIDGNYTVDYIYAGDLFGNLWKFDVSSSSSSSWQIASKGGNPAPLFIATDSTGKAQPITSAPVVGLHPSQPGLMIDFGTGQFLEQGDETITSVQSIYAVWDRLENTSTITTIGSSSNFGRTVLFPQNVLSTNTTQFTSSDAGITANTPFNWYFSQTGSGLPTDPTKDGYLGWYMDLLEPDGTALGERVTSNPTLIGDRLIIVSDTYTSMDPCIGNSSSWITEVNMANGMRPSTSNFDYNGDGVISDADLVDLNGTKVVGTRIRLKNGDKLSGLTIIADPTTHNEVKLSSTSSGKIAKVLEKGDQAYTGRRSWIELLP